MGAFLVVLAFFAGWTLIGLALLALVRAETSDLRVALTAPALGACVTLLFVFAFSEAGMATEHCAEPVGIVLLGISALILALRRPLVHPGALLVAAVCVGGLLLISAPMFSFGFGWLANGNDDMANYVLSAQDLMRHGVLAAVDVNGLLHGREYATVLAELHREGARPGSDMLLAFASSFVGRPAYQMFMPVIVAFNLCTASATGALALQFTRRWWAAAVAIALVLVSPMATYGVLQQLLAQVLGLGLVAALFALLMRPELHHGSGPRLREVVPIFALSAALVLSYVELVPQMGLAYLVYLGVLALRKQLTLAALARLWLPVIALVVIVLNAYFFKEVGFVKGQSEHGLGASSFPPLFGYVLVPSALPGIFGLQTLPPGAGAPHLDLTIVLAMAAITSLLVASVACVRRGAAAATVLLVDGVLAILLAAKSGDFGIFKLTMYVQPFVAALLAAGVAALMARAASRRWQAQTPAVACVGALGVLVAAQLSTQHSYVTASRDPGDVPNLSSSELIPAFHAGTARASSIVSVTTNPVVIKLEAASSEGRTLFFQSRNVFLNLLEHYKEEGRRTERGAGHALRFAIWRRRAFDLRNGKGARDLFEESVGANEELASGHCTLALPGTGEEPLNRYSLGPSHPVLVLTPCTAPTDVLAFTSSQLGESFYLPYKRKNVGINQIQPDPFAPSQSIAGFGRYALFRVLGWKPGSRIELSLTSSLIHDASNELPPAAVVGATRVPLPLLGRGSARVFSPSLQPQLIDGVPYLLVDMGENGRLAKGAPHGLQGLYGRSVPTDIRYLTCYVRDISLVSPSRYAQLRPPLALKSFPGDLYDDALEYSGIYEDGWAAGDSFARLAGGAKADLVIRGEVPAGAGKHLQVLVDGRLLASRPVAAGPLEVRIPVPASSSPRRVELRFAATIHLAAPDLRPASVLLSFLGFVPVPTR
jgi:hypothetical protein